MATTTEKSAVHLLKCESFETQMYLYIQATIFKRRTFVANSVGKHHTHSIQCGKCSISSYIFSIFVFWFQLSFRPTHRHTSMYFVVHKSISCEHARYVPCADTWMDKHSCYISHLCGTLYARLAGIFLRSYPFTWGGGRQKRLEARNVQISTSMVFAKK